MTSHSATAPTTTPSRDLAAPSGRTIILTTAAVAVTAVILQIQLHEYAHAVAAWLPIARSPSTARWPVTRRPRTLTWH